MNTPHACTRSICWVDKLDSQKKKEKSKKKISRKGLSQKSKKLILTIKYQLKDTFDVSPFLFILHAMVHPILIKLFKFTAFPSLFFYKVWKRFNIEQKGYRTAQKNNQMFLVFQQYFSKPFFKKTNLIEENHYLQSSY